jgi:hypothetical protein
MDTCAAIINEDKNLVGMVTQTSGKTGTYEKAVDIAAISRDLYKIIQDY